MFDSGAQISLIQRETADSLHLNGRDITINIVKGGGDEEEIQTKMHEVAVSGMNDSKKYVIKAVGVPCVSEEIKRVRVSELAEQFDLPRRSVKRRRGNLDLFIGIDHVYMHTGPTKQVNHLVLESPHLVGLYLAPHLEMEWMQQPPFYT